MNPSQFNKNSHGVCQKTLEGYYAFTPAALPPHLDSDWDLIRLISEADQALGELSGAGQLLPNPHLLIRPYLRREAILSSRIEDTHAEMGQLALFEEEEEAQPVSDVREVANYVRALEHGLRRIIELPISTRLIKESHELLLKDVRGGREHKNTRGVSSQPKLDWSQRLHAKRSDRTAKESSFRGSRNFEYYVLSILTSKRHFG